MSALAIGGDPQDPFCLTWEGRGEKQGRWSQVGLHQTLLLLCIRWQILGKPILVPEPQFSCL